jgi:A/G-specific adenine glycosylase
VKKNTFFSSKIINWYQVNKRDLIWRGLDDPYFIWLSEIILQQTRVAQGTPYYLRFSETFPTVQDFAAASEEEILTLWQGLGYYSRARNMHFTAKMVVNEYGGEFPNTYKELLKLKGVGTYTAAAIASIAFGENVATVDGNVYRVLSRVFGVKTDILSTKAKKEFFELANSLLPKGQAATFNQAVMEFGALYCKPSSPNCEECIFMDNCYAFAHKKQNELPVKIKKIKIRKRYFHYLVFEFEGSFLIKKRLKGDIWQGLYDFHLVEKGQTLDTENLIEDLEYLQAQNSLILKQESKVFKHLLSHQTIFAKFYHFELKNRVLFEQIATELSLEVHSLEKIHNLPKPILIKNYIDEFI